MRRLLPGERHRPRPTVVSQAVPQAVISDHVLNCSGDLVHRSGIKAERRITDDLSERAAGRASHGATAGHRLERRGANPSSKTADTFFERLEELEPGAWLERGSDGEERSGRYWELGRPTPNGMSYEEAVEGTRERLIRSVELRLRADVPLAFCMSGGLDSMSVISIARDVFEYDVHDFTIVNEDARYAEQDMVEYAKRGLGVRHTAIRTESSGFRCPRP